MARTKPEVAEVTIETTAGAATKSLVDPQENNVEVNMKMLEKTITSLTIEVAKEGAVANVDLVKVAEVAEEVTLITQMIKLL